MGDLDAFYVHTASVETLLGASAYGDLFAAPVSLACFIDDDRVLVRSKDGQEVVSQTVLYCDPSYAALFTTDSRVTANGDVSRVMKVNVNTSGALQLPDHVAVHLV
jgi:hypothetical protein